jgi:hypothetical protein
VVPRSIPRILAIGNGEECSAICARRGSST